MTDQTPAVVRLDGSEGLTQAESKALTRHEKAISTALDKASLKAGEALRAIRDGRLYRAEHGSFETYCLEVWGFCAWGGGGQALLRLRPPIEVMAERSRTNLCCLGKTLGGQPRHPLYLRADTPLVTYRPAPVPKKGGKK